MDRIPAHPSGNSASEFGREAGAVRLGLSGLGFSAPQSGEVYHPLFGQAMKYEAQMVGDDPDSQVEATIQTMARYAAEDAQRPEIQGEAREIREACGPDRIAQTAEVHRRVRARIRFLRDEETAMPLAGISPEPIVEILVRPIDMYYAGAGAGIGDCDDYSMYAAALLTALGIDCSFVTLAADPGSNQFTHVYVAAYPDGQRVAVDASHGPYCGWEAPRPGARKQEWPVGDPMRNCGGGLSTLLVLAGVAGLSWWVIRQ